MATMEIQIVQLMERKSRQLGRRITQDEVAAAVGIPRGTVSRWAGNKVDRLDRDVLARLCEYFECGIEELLVFKDK